MGQCYSFLYDCLQGNNNSTSSSSVVENQSSATTTAIKMTETTPLLTNNKDTTANIPAAINGEVKEHPHAVTAAIPIVNSENSLVSSNLIASKYDIKEVIGVGSTSTCHRVLQRSTGKSYACKIIDKRQVDMKFSGLLDQFHVEISVLKQLRHPNIIHLADVYETNEKIYMVMEMMKGGELFDYVVEKGTLSEEEASVIVRKITSAVSFMHSLNIIHRDLKPENLLLTSKAKDAEVKIIDFGLAKEMTDTREHARSFLGTKGYLAPEMLLRHAYDKSVDIWALGVIVFVLLCGCLPFDDDSSRIPSELVAKKKFTLRFPNWATNLSSSAKDILQKLLDVDPKTRITADQALSHPWVSGKSVLPNNYLQSPSLLGERRKILRSPETPHMKALKQQMTLANGGKEGDAQDMLTKIHDAVGSRNGRPPAISHDDGSGAARKRKNSI